jgi:hypothetical protein
MNTKTDVKIRSNAARAMAEEGQLVARLLREKLLAEITPEQRDILFTTEQLISLNDAVFAGNEAKIVHRPETNLSHARIVAEVQHGHQLLTGCDWYKVQGEDRERSNASVERAGLEDVGG